MKNQTVISVENLSKAYQLGQISTGTLSRDLSVWWARLRGKPNPLLKIGQAEHNNRDGDVIWALREVNFQVEQGEVLGVIGRNGAGKSTLLKILSRVTAPTSGKVRVRGRIASLLEVGTGFHPELTGRENVYLNGAILGMTREEVRRKFDEIVDFAEVEKFIDTPVKRYSSGMYVRLAFAVAAHLDPEILLVDEVLAVGDAEFQKKCLGKMGDVARQGRTVIFVSHDMGSIRRLCELCTVLRSGEIVYWGKAEDAIEEYLGAIKGNQIWENPDPKQDVPFHIISARIVDINGKVTSRFPMGSKVIFELCTLVDQTITSSHIHLMVEYKGTILFRTFDTDDHPQLLSARQPGKSTSRVILDTSYLKPGNYEISVDTGIRPIAILEKHLQIATFEIIDPEGDYDRGWSTNRQGVIRAPVTWEIPPT